MPASRYRWLIAAAAATMLGIAFGMIVNGLSVFLTPLQTSFGWARGEVAAINSAGLIGLAVGGFAVSFVADRVHIRWLALFGSLIVALALLAAAQAQTLWQFYAIFFLAGLLGGAALYGPLFALVGNWFPSGAGLAIGIAAAGQAVGQGLVPYAGAWLIQALGWRGALVGFGIFAAATLIPLSFTLRPAPAAERAAQASRQANYLPRHVTLIALPIAVLGCCTGMSTPLMHLVPLIEGCGFPAPQASSVLLTLMIAAIGGRLAFGKLSDMIGAIPAYLTAVVWQTALIFLFTQINDLRIFYFFAPIYGFGYGGVMTGLLAAIRALTPPARLASTTGFVMSFAWMGHGLGGWQGGATFDATGSYTWGFADAAAAGVLTTCVLLYLLVATRRSGSADLAAAPERQLLR